jgi:hypothetical protein
MELASKYKSVWITESTIKGKARVSSYSIFGPVSLKQQLYIIRTRARYNAGLSTPTPQGNAKTLLQRLAPKTLPNSPWDKKLADRRHNVDFPTMCVER